MKKIILSLIVLITLCGCANSNQVMVSDPNTNIIEGGSNYTKQQLFESMKYNDYTSVILGSLVEKIASFEGVNLDEIDAQVEEDIAEMKEQYGDSYEYIISYYGSEDTVKANLRSSHIAEKLSNSYYDANIDSLKETYKPLLGKYIYFDTVEAAEQMLSEIAEGKSFEMAAADAGYGYAISESVLTDKSSLPVEVKEFINGITEPTLSDIIITESTQTNSDGSTSVTTRYYIVEITNTNSDEFTEEFYSALNSLVDATEIYNYFFNKYNVEVYDQRTYDLLSSKYEGIK